MLRTFPLLFLLCPPFSSTPDAPTRPPTAAVVSAVSVLRPAGIGGRLAFVAVQKSGHDDQNGPEEEHTVEDTGQRYQLQESRLRERKTKIKKTQG